MILQKQIHLLHFLTHTLTPSSITNVTPDSVHVRDFLNGGLSLLCLVIATFSFATLYIMTSRASVPLPLRQRQFQ
jgi:hypothetical protein